MQEPGTRGRDSFLELAELAIGLAISYMLEGTGLVGAETSQLGGSRDAYASVEQRQLADALRRLVDALPERERMVVQSHYYQGLSFTEVAERLGVTKGRVSQIHRQALQLLREAHAADGQLDLSG
jgi:RNA polymerase sigma factor for flagellar operon FliA